MNIPVDIFLCHPDAVVPEYKTSGAVAFDLAVVETQTIAPHQTALFPTGLVIRVPDGYALILASRSSNAKKDIDLANSIGIIDQDYCGPTDEIRLVIRNFGSEPFTIHAGDRVAQGMIVPIARAAFRSISKPDAVDRGGYGTTGT